MNGIVVDASVTLSWCFADEQAPLSLKVLDRLKSGEQALVACRSEFVSMAQRNSLLTRAAQFRASSDSQRNVMHKVTRRQALVPAFWSVEVLNSLLVGERRGRISPEQTRAFLGDLAALRPTLDCESLEQVYGPVQTLCRDHRLTPYDALYVELAMRSQCPLATLDQSQKNAAGALSIECL